MSNTNNNTANATVYYLSDNYFLAISLNCLGIDYVSCFVKYRIMHTVLVILMIVQHDCSAKLS